MDEQSPESQQPADYLKTVEPLQKHKKRRFIKFVLLLVVLFSVLGFFGFSYLKNRPTNSVTQKPETEASKQPEIGINTITKSHSSSQFSLDFDYPQDWEIKDEQSGGFLTATSPNISIPTNGSTITGKVILTIKGKNQKLPEFDSGNALAVRLSEKISYNKPSAVQRAQTHISFLSFVESEATTIDAIYITGDFGYTKDQAIPKIDIQKIDPVISITFLSCDGICTKNIGINPESWDKKEFGGELKKILQSIVIN